MKNRSQEIIKIYDKVNSISQHLNQHDKTRNEHALRKKKKIIMN